MQSQVLIDVAACFPGKRIFYKRAGQTSHEVSQYYLQNDRRPPEFACCCIEPNIVVLNEQDHSLFVETNTHAMIGPRINRMNRPWPSGATQL
jgi:hypothetical protein